ncbi:MAG: GerAB/ArcD/ProY family transporter [Bacillota bacterium]
MSSGSPRVGFGEAVALLVVFLSMKVLISHLALIFPLGLSASWMIPLMHLPVGLVGVAVIVWLLNRFPGRTIVEIGEELVGPVVNGFFVLLYYAFFVVFTALVLRQFAEFVLIGFFPETPLSIVVLAFAASATVIVFLGLETLARTARVLFYLLGFSFVLLLLLTSNVWSQHGIFPLWGPGAPELFWAAFSTLGVGVEIFLLTMLAPYLPRGRMLAVGLVSVLAAGAAVALAILVSLLVFTYPAVREPVLPMFELARIVMWGRFFVRMETLFLPLWIFSALIGLAAALYICTAVAARALKLPYHRPLILPTMVLILAGAFAPPNYSTAVELGFAVTARWSFIPLGAIVGVLVAAAWLRGRRRQRE